MPKAKPVSILDLMAPADRDKAIEKGKKRLAKNQGADVSPEMYYLAKFGLYFGFEAVMAVRRGYTQSFNTDGTVSQEQFTLEEMMALVDAADKVTYASMIRNATGNMIATHSAHTRDPGGAFNKGMKPFKDKAEIK